MSELTPRDYGAQLLPQHAAMLEASGIAVDVAGERGYRSIETKAELQRKGFSPAQRNVPGLLIPVYDSRGEFETYQYRPDEPRVAQDGRPIKYETPAGSHMVIDVPKRAHPWLGDPERSLFITEGARKADAAVSEGLCCIALLGVWNWRGTNGAGGKTVLADWDDIALNGRTVYIAFDSDVMTKRSVFEALSRLKAMLEKRDANVRIIYLEGGESGQKQGLDDFLASGHTSQDLIGLAEAKLRRPSTLDSDSVAEAMRAQELAQPLLDSPRLLDVVADAVRSGGYAGDVRPAMLAYIALTSRLLERPLNLAFVAPAAAGKNRAVDAALALVPETAYHMERAGSERALIYSGEDFENRMVVVAEADSIPDEGPAASAVRSLAEDNLLAYDVVEKDPESGRHETRRIEKRGPTGLITTSTKPLADQLSTRMLTVPLADGPDQIRAVLRAHAAAVGDSRTPFDATDLIAAQRWLELAGDRSVTIPFARTLAELVPADLVRMNRDFRQLLTVIQALALLYQRQRERDTAGAIVATLADYRMARQLVADVFTATATGGVTQAVRETVQAVASLSGGDRGVTVSAVAQRLELHISSASRRVSTALRLGFLVNNETRPRQPAQLMPGNPLPEDRPALPELQVLTRHLHAESSAIVQTGSVLPNESVLEPACSEIARLHSDPEDCTCSHRPTGEVDALWREKAPRWGSGSPVCTCCAGPILARLHSSADGRCPTCQLGRTAPAQGEHLLRFVLDLGGTLKRNGSEAAD